MRVAMFGFLILFFPLSLGCASCEVVEAELRYQANKVESLERKLALREAELQALRDHAYPAEYKPGESPNRPNDVPVPGSTGEPLGATIVKTVLGQQTGVRDLDRDGKEDALHIFLSPLDAVGDAIKVPGRVEIEVLQLTETGLTKGLGTWKYDAGDLVSRWRPSVLGSGYQFILPWQEPPACDRLRIKTRFTTTTGRAYETAKEVTISRTNSLFRGSAPAAPGTVPPGKKSTGLNLLPPAPNSTGLGETWLETEIVE